MCKQLLHAAIVTQDLCSDVAQSGQQAVVVTGQHDSRTGELTLLLSWDVVKVSLPCPSLLTVCRAFVALRERLENTWVNNYEYFVSDYAADSDATSLTREEVCSHTNGIFTCLASSLIT